jgi:hypothetical protein
LREGHPVDVTVEGVAGSAAAVRTVTTPTASTTTIAPTHWTGWHPKN